MGAAEVISGIIAFFKAIPTLDRWLQQLIAAYVNGLEEKNLKAIADAAAFAARAKTQDERFAAAQMWQDALSRKRVTE